MLALEFSLKLSSMFSIRIPYSYQCARTYPLPAPSTLKGLCANALWLAGDKDLKKPPHEIIQETAKSIVSATATTTKRVAVTSCTVSQITDPGKKEGKCTNALLRQFAHTPEISCILVFLKGQEQFAASIAEALKYAPIYLGDSESLATVLQASIVGPITDCGIAKTRGEKVTGINTSFLWQLAKSGTVVACNDGGNGTVLYMQDDPISPEAELRRYLAPLQQVGDDYLPIEGFSFELAEDCYLVEGKSLRAIFPCSAIETREKGADVSTKKARTRSGKRKKS